MKKTVLILLLTTSITRTNFITDSIIQYKAHRALQANDLKKSQQDYTSLLEKSPYDPATNYNLGLTFFKQKQFDQAFDGFARAAKHAQPKSKLQEQSFFNQGNTFVELQKLQEAINAYEKTLEINPNNDHAQHNIEIVKKMLQQEEQKKDKDNSDKQNDKNKDKQKNDKNQKSENQQEQDSHDQDSKENDDSQDSNNKKDQKTNKDQQEHPKENYKNRDEKQDNPDENQTKEQSADKLEKSKQQEQQQDDSLKKSYDKQNKKNDTSSQDTDKQDQQEAALQDDLAAQVDPNNKNDERLNKKSATLMQKMKDHEDHIQKQLLKMNVSKQGETKHGQKNW